ncbi:WXG100 family type VII secretion target [Streptomyces mirabilis]|uniref:WXG100 family type VII secretion target n=1 Tax=Streptomyces mirabilis TaxID=68239 RepID=UPI0007659E61|nr:WXG100 family type VII secretion target [Streptomyces mirabilis]MCX4428687.1 WXG100 family type VII secretion target [Streptomyces mirabilis]
MATYEVSFSQMEFVAGEMDTITKNIQEMIRNLDDSSKQRLAEWSSDARQTYNVAKAKWDAAAEVMQVQAQKATASLGTITEHYVHGEKYGMNLWES